jgi:iron(III) transport system substrate-binding protein
MGLLSKTASTTLEKNIPAHLRSPENTWFALSKRSRILATSKDRVGAAEITRIEDLADPKWKGRICTRPGSHVYNRALMASIIAHHGSEAAEEWAKGLVANLARKPQGNDRAQVKAIYEGVCDVALINSYYYGNMKFSEDAEQRAWADAMNIVFPNQGENDRGAHINVSGGGVAIHSKNKEAAIKLLEFLSEATSQKLYGEVNYEYPVNPAVIVDGELASWGTFKEDQLPIQKIADLSREAQMMIDRVGW